MTGLLLRLFAKDRKNRAQIGRLSGITGLICNILLCAAKLVVGILSGSVSITADAMNNLSDAASSVITLLGFKLAEKPADKDHPYGHARFEYLSGLAVAALILVIGFELLKSSVSKIINPTPILFSLPLALVLVLSVIIKLWLTVFNRKLASLIDSAALFATASDSRNDVIATLSVLAAAIVEFTLHWHVDGYIGLLVALFILYSGIMLAKETINPLLGEAASPQLQKLIIQTVKSNPKVLGYHDLMVHDYGPEQRFASLHVEMDQKEDPLVCHDIIDDLERECLHKHNVHLVIHYDPVGTDDTVLCENRCMIEQLLSGIDTRLSVHDFRMVCGTTHTNLIFDIALPDDMNDQKAYIKSYLEQEMFKKTGKTYYTVITFDPLSFN